MVLKGSRRVAIGVGVLAYCLAVLLGAATLFPTTALAANQEDFEGDTLVLTWSDATSSSVEPAIFDLGETKHLALAINNPSKGLAPDSFELVLRLENPESALYRDSQKSGYSLDAYTAAGGLLTALDTKADEQTGVTTLVYTLDPNVVHARIELLLTAAANQVYDGEKLKITAHLSAMTAGTETLLGSLDCTAHVKMNPIGLTGSLRLIEPSRLAEGAQTAKVGWSYEALTTNDNWSEESQLGEYRRRGVLFDTFHTSLDFSNVVITAQGITHTYAEWQSDFAEYGFASPPVAFKAADGAELVLNRLIYDTASSAATVPEFNPDARIFMVETSSEFISAGGIAPAIDLKDGLDTGVGVSLGCRINGRGPFESYQQFHAVYYREQGHPLDVPLVYVNTDTVLRAGADVEALTHPNPATSEDTPTDGGVTEPPAQALPSACATSVYAAVRADAATGVYRSYNPDDPDSIQVVNAGSQDESTLFYLHNGFAQRLNNVKAYYFLPATYVSKEVNWRTALTGAPSFKLEGLEATDYTVYYTMAQHKDNRQLDAHGEIDDKNLTWTLFTGQEDIVQLKYITAFKFEFNKMDAGATFTMTAPYGVPRAQGQALPLYNNRAIGQTLYYFATETEGVSQVLLQGDTANTGAVLLRQTDAPSLQWPDTAGAAGAAGAAGEKSIPPHLSVEQGIDTIPAWDTVLVYDDVTPDLIPDTITVDYYATENRTSVPTDTQVFEVFSREGSYQSSLRAPVTGMPFKTGTICTIDFAGKQATDYISAEKPGVFVVTYRSAKDDDKQATDATLTLVVAPAVALTYDGNGASLGAPPLDAQSPYVVGTTVEVLPHAGLARSGFAFEGWSVDPYATSAQYVTGSTFTITGEVTLFAVWRQDSAPASHSTDTLAHRLQEVLGL